MVIGSRKIVSLAISGQCCSGKSTLCRIISGKLGWIHVDIGNEFRKLAELEGLEIERFGAVPDTLLRQIDEKILQHMKNETNTVWDGRLACYLARNNDRVFKVYCVAQLEIRIERAAFRDEISPRKAKQRILARDNEEANVFKRLYDLSTPYDPKWVDLLIDTSADSPATLSNTILKVLYSKAMG
jgi:predicted cytidylate kinase